MRTGLIAGSLIVLAAASGCTESRLRDQPDFGEAVRQDVAVQIADPDARYAGVPQPGANGMKADAAQERYVRGKVIPPASTTTSTIGGGGDTGASGSAAPPPSGPQ